MFQTKLIKFFEITPTHTINLIFPASKHFKSEPTACVIGRYVNVLIFVLFCLVWNYWPKFIFGILSIFCCSSFTDFFLVFVEIIGVAVISDMIDFSNRYSAPPTGVVGSCVCISVCISGRRIVTYLLSDFGDNLSLSFW